MQTHNDSDSLFMDRLKERATKMANDKLSEITAGKDDEKVRDEWEHDDMHVTHRPDDEQGILRISIGGGIREAQFDYCVFRGDRIECMAMLEKALAALRYGASTQRSKDERSN